MYHPTTRVLTVLELLQSREYISGPELAQRLEVSVRSIRGYIRQLQDLGIPIEAEYGRYGGYRLRPGFKLPPLMFHEDKAVALTLGLLVARSIGLMVAAPAVEGALAKIERVLPQALRERVLAIQETLVINGQSPYQAPGSEIVGLLSQATQACQRVRFHYQRWDARSTERSVDPYGVVHHGGRWFVAGYCHLRHERRVFRVDRIAELQLCQETFSRPAGFDSLAFVIESLARTPGTWQIEVLLKTNRAAIQQCVPRSMALLEETEAGIIMRCAVQQLDWFAHFLVGLGCELVVFQPPELRAALHRLAERVERIAAT